MQSRELKAISALKVLKLLCDNAPRSFSTREIASRLELNPRAVQRYLRELRQLVDLRQDGRRYWVVMRATRLRSVA